MAFIPIYDTNPLRNIRRPWVAWSLIARQHPGLFPGRIGHRRRGQRRLGDRLRPVPRRLQRRRRLARFGAGRADADHLRLPARRLLAPRRQHDLPLGARRQRRGRARPLCASSSSTCCAPPAPATPSCSPTPPPTGPVIGASGAIAGTIAAYLILHPRAKMWVLAFGRIPLRLSAVYVLGFWIVFQVFAALHRRRGQRRLVVASRRPHLRRRAGAGHAAHGTRRCFDRRPVDDPCRGQPIGSPPDRGTEGPVGNEDPGRRSSGSSMPTSRSGQGGRQRRRSRQRQDGHEPVRRDRRSRRRCG